MRGDIFIFELCQLYGWSYAQYEQNPDWFNEAATWKYMIDAKPHPKSG